ncbi:hypothetical protein PQX77_011282 [Marasmius sp. AFHP31]|nr:hypothetical protein PQX77_011282 [Marasmius sp. AFHP31]
MSQEQSTDITIARLSGLLAKATQNQTYLDAASQSLSFIHNHLYNDRHIVGGSIASDTCETSSSIEPCNSAFMIEGMSILHTITNNQSTLQLLRDTLAATIYNKDWQGDDGIISWGSARWGDWCMVHALSYVYQRNSTEPDLRNYIRDYLTVQYNALSDLATAGGSIYGGSWVGPPGTQLDSNNQTTALTVLVSAITLEGTTSSVPPPVESGGTSPGSNTSGGTRSSSGAIIGGSVGGVFFLVALGVGVGWLLRRRHWQKGDYQPFSKGATSNYLTVTPFTEHLKNGNEYAESQGGAVGARRNLKHENGHLVTPIRRPAPPTSHRSASTSSSDQGTASVTVNELMAELRDLRLQQSRLLERTREENDSPPPEYCSVRSERRD